jgi:hypothetical protein
MSGAERLLVICLRLGAAVLLLAVLTALLPFSWMAATNAWLGLSDLPDTPLVGYLTRSLSALYAFHGALLLVLAQDVRRYRPLIRFLAVASIVFGAFMLGLDLSVGMPGFWALAEGPFIIAAGACLLYLQRRCPADPSNPPTR